MIFIQILLISLLAEARVEWHERGSRSWVRSLGLELTDNLRVASVKPGSFAQMVAPECGGIRTDDLIMTVNGKTVGNLDEFEKQMRKSARRHTQMWSFLIQRQIPFMANSKSGGTKGSGLGKETRKESRYFVAEVGGEYLKTCDPVRLRGCGPTPGSRLIGRSNKNCDYRKSPRLKDRI